MCNQSGKSIEVDSTNNAVRRNQVWFNQVCMVQVWKYTSILDQKVNKESGSEFPKRYLLLSTYFCIMQNSQESQNNMMYNKFFNF